MDFLTIWVFSRLLESPTGVVSPSTASWIQTPCEQCQAAMAWFRKKHINGTSFLPGLYIMSLTQRHMHTPFRKMFVHGSLDFVSMFQERIHVTQGITNRLFTLARKRTAPHTRTISFVRARELLGINWALHMVCSKLLKLLWIL